MDHPVFEAGRSAVITGAASGIGRAAAKRLASLGMRVVIADINGPLLAEAADEVAAAAPGGDGSVVALASDISTDDGMADLVRAGGADHVAKQPAPALQRGPLRRNC